MLGRLLRCVDAFCTSENSREASGDAGKGNDMSTHSVRNAVLVAAIAGLATAVRHELEVVRDLRHRPSRPPRIGETALGEPGEVLWYC